MWQMNTEIVPVVVGALGVIKKGSEKRVREIPRNINLYRIFKRQHYRERHKCYGRSHPSSDNKPSSAPGPWRRKTVLRTEH